MNFRIVNLSLILIAVLAGTVSCRHSPTKGSDTLSDEGANTDIQTIKVESRGTIMFSSESQVGVAQYRNCDYTDTAIINGSQGARANCTSAVATAKDLVMVNRYVEPQATYNGSPGNAARFRHWCHGSEVTVAVKKAAYDSASFQGIGFYGRDNIINNANTDQRTYYPKTSSLMKIVGSAKLKNEGNQEVHLIKFFAAGPCEVSGTGRNPTGKMVFKPYVSFDGFVERWENVPDNHGISYAQSWDRSADLLAP